MKEKLFIVICSLKVDFGAKINVCWEIFFEKEKRNLKFFQNFFDQHYFLKWL
jgi:hypothetical protein